MAVLTHGGRHHFPSSMVDIATTGRMEVTSAENHLVSIMHFDIRSNSANSQVDPSDPPPFLPGVRIVIKSDTTLMIASHSHVGFASLAGRPIAANATVICECTPVRPPHSPVPLKHGE